MQCIMHDIINIIFLKRDVIIERNCPQWLKGTQTQNHLCIIWQRSLWIRDVNLICFLSSRRRFPWMTCLATRVNSDPSHKVKESTRWNLATTIRAGQTYKKNSAWPIRKWLVSYRSNHLWGNRDEIYEMIEDGDIVQVPEVPVFTCNEVATA